MSADSAAATRLGVLSRHFTSATVDSVFAGLPDVGAPAWVPGIAAMSRHLRTPSPPLPLAPSLHPSQLPMPFALPLSCCIRSLLQLTAAPVSSVHSAPLEHVLLPVVMKVHLNLVAYRRNRCMDAAIMQTCTAEHHPCCTPRACSSPMISFSEEDLMHPSLPSLQAPPDPILAVGDAWRADPHPAKLNLGGQAPGAECGAQGGGGAGCRPRSKQG
ncbi:hypothetical protein HaLaN_01640, partial [Haematococcus lacustris]